MSIYEKLNITSPVAVIIISIAVMLISGFAMTRLTKLLKLPNVTAYITAGILIGPFCLNLVPENVITGMDFMADIALAFIAFGTGEYFRISTLKKNGAKVIFIMLFEAAAASALVFVLTYVILGLPLGFSLVLTSLAPVTAPTSTMMTIRQTGAKGDFVDTLLEVIAIDDVAGLVTFGIALSIAGMAQGGGNTINLETVLKPLIINAIVILLGALFGFLMKFLMPKKRTTDNRLIISIAMLFTFCGVCALFDVSPLLGCMSMGMVYINVTNDDKLFMQLNYFSPPILLLFFVRSGSGFKLDSLVSRGAAVAGIPLIVIAVLYFAVRMIGKYGGSFLGCLTVRKKKQTRNYLGLALMPQGGVAIALASLAARTLGGDLGSTVQTVILSSSILYEIIGPASAKLALYLSGSYSNKLDEILPDDVLPANEDKLSEVDKLIEKIRIIREELPERGDIPSEEEQAFLEAAEEQYAMVGSRRNRRQRR